MLIETLDQVDSTNEEAKRRLEAGAEGVHWLRASMQTAGRGTHGRAWDSPDGAGLYLTRYARHEEPLLPDGLTPTVGIAFGLDRLIQLIFGLKRIEEAYPLYVK